MAKLIWDNIAYNLEDALDELQKLDKRISSGDIPDEVEFQIAMKHIYHHLNFAWNTRHDSTENHAGMTKNYYLQSSS